MSVPSPDESVAALARALAFAPGLALLARTRLPRTREYLLASPTRRAIVETVEAHPGLTLGELRTRLRLGWGNGYHHLRKLESAGLVATRRVGRRLVIHPAGRAADDATAQALGVLRGRSAREVCEDVAQHPGTDVSDVARRTGQSARAVYYHVRQLGVVGLIESRSRTRAFALHATPLYASLAPSLAPTLARD